MTLLAEPILKLFRKADVPNIEVGDVVRVHQKIREGAKERVQVFEGIVIAKSHGVSANASFTVRKIASGVGVEKVFLLHSPNIVKVEFKRGSDVKRAKLYYLRALTGKALKMKDKTIRKDAWAEILQQDTDTQTEASEADIEEAVVAEATREAEAATTETTIETPAEVEVNESAGEATNEATEESNSEGAPADDASNTGIGEDAQGNGA